MPKRTREQGAGRALVPGRSSWPGCPTGDMLLANVRVMNVVRESDGARVSTRVEVSTPVDILVQGGRITSMRATLGDVLRVRAGEVFPASPAFNGSGRVVMAGLVDAHVHCTASSSDLRSPAGLPPSLVTARAVKILGGMLHRGFTTVRDAGGADCGLSAAVEEGTVEGPRLHFCGKALSATGGHGDFRGTGEQQLPCKHCADPTIGKVVDGVRACRQAVREEVRKGATHIKIMASGGVSSPTDRLNSLQFSREELEALVGEARLSGTPTMAHAYTPQAIARAVEVGCASIEHGNYADMACLAAMKAAGTFLVPTIVTYWAILEEGEADGMPRALVDKVGDLVEAGLDAVRRATEAGVDIAYGSDLLGRSHVHQLKGIPLHAKVQPPADVLASLTIGGARLLGQEGEIGVIKEGAWADMLLLEDGDAVLRNPALLAEPGAIRAVFQGGRCVSSEDYQIPLPIDPTSTPGAALIRFRQTRAV